MIQPKTVYPILLIILIITFYFSVQLGVSIGGFGIAFYFSRKTFELINANKTKNDHNQEHTLAQFLQRPNARKFWITHFGEKTYSVPYNRFIDALNHEFVEKDVSSLFENTIGTEELKKGLYKNGKVTIYNFASFTKISDLEEKLLEILNDINNSTNLPSENNLKKQLSTSVTNIKLKLIGINEILSCKGVEEIIDIQHDFGNSNSLTLGRKQFWMLPKDFLNRISRIHCIINKIDFDSNSVISVTDKSNNGTFLNSNMIGKDNTKTVNNNDKIVLLMNATNRTDIELGFEVNFIGELKPKKGKKRKRLDRSTSNSDLQSLGTYLELPQLKKRKIDTTNVNLKPTITENNHDEMEGIQIYQETKKSEKNNEPKKTRKKK